MKTEGRSLLGMFDDAPVEAKRLIKAARRLANRKGRAELVLAGALARLARDGRTGKQDFDEFLREELGVRYRKAMYLIGIHDHFHRMDIDERRLATMGWSKAKELIGIATRENFDDLADFAERNKRTALIEHLNANYGRAASITKSRARTGGRMSFSLSRDQAETVQRALDMAKAKVGTDDAGEALALVCGEWVVTRA
ncbi:hypothetical protein G3545_29245 [Starkeya sp. ORNL1]|uniref:hypothetical protein n=1 Tax=Starkeya sp. ORNL1 TaxID=2709380 RepID=UPI001464788C|nr:hypothetical protein [Starkeya sp. ORNL1]QJP17369.1 hypothetical protein G3545_29245 [Starkeya sp. ORNL1]